MLSKAFLASNKEIPLSLQALPRECAHFCLFFERMWKAYALPENQRLLLALSGGADSTALALLLRVLAKRLNLDLFAATVNHGLREEAGREVAGVMEFCKKIQIPCTARAISLHDVQKERRIGLEEAARTMRYEVLEEERKKRVAHYLCTAHHLDDLTEDVLMRLSRGTGWPGLGGMCMRDDSRFLLRPLLMIRKKDLQLFLERLHVHWFEDASNRDLSFTRNRFRHEIVPFFLRENPRFSESVAHIWQIAEYDREFWESYLSDLISQHPWHMGEENGTFFLELPSDLLVPLKSAVRIRLFQKALHALWLLSSPPPPPLLSASKLFAIEDVFQRRMSGKYIQLPKGLLGIVRKKGIRFEH